MIRFDQRQAPGGFPSADESIFIGAATMEISPRSVAKIASFRDLLPAGRTVYIAHLAGVSVDEMVDVARRLTDAGYRPMPHIAARAIATDEELRTLLSRYAYEAGVRQALVIAGNATHPIGRFDTAMELIECGHFDELRFERIHFAAHPEGNGAVPPEILLHALASKREYAARTDAAIGLTTQFLFDPDALVTWLKALQARGMDLPVHVGIAGPTNPITLLKYALACGVGPSVKILQKQARNVRNLVKPYTPDLMLTGVADHLDDLPNFAGFHVFPFGGVAPTADWIRSNHEKSCAGSPT